MVAEPISALELLLARLRHRSSELLDIDLWDRWGKHHASEPEIAERAANERRALADQAVAKTALEVLVARLRAEQPSAIAAWADAHDAFLAAFIADCGESPDTATARFVAAEERDGWAKVKRGEQPYVVENCFYITIERERYRAAFGIDP